MSAADHGETDRVVSALQERMDRQDAEIGKISGQLSALVGRVELAEKKLDAAREFMSFVMEWHATEDEIDADVEVRLTDVCRLANGQDAVMPGLFKRLTALEDAEKQDCTPEPDPAQALSALSEKIEARKKLIAVE